jgi:hypothetical protein
MTQSRVNIGLRFVLPVYPFLFVCASRLATSDLRPNWKGLVLLGVPLVLTVVSSLKVAPHQVAYFNELVGGPRKGFIYLGDSNLDWGQDLKGIKPFLEKEGVSIIYLCYFGTAPPTHYGVRYQYVPGYPTVPEAQPEVLPVGSRRELLVISMSNLQGIYLTDRTRYHWLYSRTPFGGIGYSINVYDLTGDSVAHSELAKIYIKEGLPDLAVAELQKVLTIEPSQAEARKLLDELERR